MFLNGAVEREVVMASVTHIVTVAAALAVLPVVHADVVPLDGRDVAALCTTVTFSDFPRQSLWNDLVPPFCFVFDDTGWSSVGAFVDRASGRRTRWCVATGTHAH